MNYRPRDSFRKPYGRGALIAVALGILLAAIAMWAPSPVRTAVRAFATPFWKSGDALSSATQLSEGLTKSKAGLIEENGRLQSELDEARRQIDSLQALAAENAELRSTLGLSGDAREIAAAVIAKPPQSAYDTLVVEVGAGARIAPGDLVFAGPDILLGEIGELSGRVAVVKLYSSPGSEVQAVIERTNVSHTAAGTGGGNFMLRVPKEVDVKLGDTLAAPGVERKVLGVVREIESRPTDSFQQILVRSPVNIFQLKWVSIKSAQ